MFLCKFVFILIEPLKAARNILVGRHNVCKVADFGLARFLVGSGQRFERSCPTYININTCSTDFFLDPDCPGAFNTGPGLFFFRLFILNLKQVNTNHVTTKLGCQ